MAAMLYRQNLVIPLLPVIGTFLREGRKESRRGEHMAREEEEPCSLVEFRLNVKRSREIKGGNEGNTRVAISLSERAREQGM